MSDTFNIDDIIAEERAQEAAQAEAEAKAQAQRVAAENAAAEKARVVMGLDTEPEGDDVPEEKPEKKAKKAKAEKPEKKKKEKKEKPQKSGKSKKFPKWLIILLGVIAVIAAVVALTVFVVYGNFYMWLYAELGDGAPDPADFVKDGSKASYVGGEPDVSLTEEGHYFLKIKSDGKERTVLLVVRDTEAPTAKSAEPVISIDDTLSPMDALEDAKDASDFEATWKAQPNFGSAGIYNASVLLSDEHGNERVIDVTVTILGAIDVLTHEAGEARPALEDFMIVERDNAELLTDFDTEIEWNVPGDYDVQISFDGATYTSTLRIVDTVAPKPDVIPAAVIKGEDISPDDFVLGCDDATAVSYEFSSAPDTATTGTVPCTITATDLGDNETEVQTTAVVCDAIIELEAANDVVTQAQIISALGGAYSGYTMETAAFSLTGLGAHEVVLTKNGEKLIVGAVVVDTTPPTAEGIECECSTGYYTDPINFVTNIVDMSSVTARFVTEPDWDVEGRQDVEIVLADRSGNETTITAVAVISPDKTAPVIYAAIDRICYVDEAVAYFKEVFAEDNADPEPELTVDKSKVDYKTAGTYPVTYTATDENGNSSSVTVNFTFVERTIDKDKLDAAIEEVFDKIFTDNMTPTEQAYAIFNYCYDHITYTGTSDKTDLYGEAYRGITQGVGDCYTFYATSYCMLEKIDCGLLSVERLNGKTQHFWCLVNLGTGWYHFDPCNVGPQHYRCFMKMTSDLSPLSAQYWRFDESLYPPVETTPFVAPD